MPKAILSYQNCLSHLQSTFYQQRELLVDLTDIPIFSQFVPAIALVVNYSIFTGGKSPSLRFSQNVGEGRTIKSKFLLKPNACHVTKVRSFV